MNKTLLQSLQIAFMYIGTIVGAGFATGQEIMQFFTRYGAASVPAMLLACVLFIWLGTRIMLLSRQIQAHSYEDLNRYLFGDRAGAWISKFMLVTLFLITAVMLAGGGSILREQAGLPYQLGLILTLTLAYLVIRRDAEGILFINSLVVPLVLVFSLVLLIYTTRSPQFLAGFTYPNESPLLLVWLSPILYVGMNLILSQAVLVPIGAAISDRKSIIWGGWLGGLGIGFMLLTGHIVLSSQMPEIAHAEIPMVQVVRQLGTSVQLLMLLLVYAEIFTTLVANVFGLMRQIEQRVTIQRSLLIGIILTAGYVVSQAGFSMLIKTLYPLIGLFSIGWLVLLMRTAEKK